MTMKTLFSLTLLGLLSLNVQAELYKCTQGGHSVFSDTPCKAGASRVDREADRIEGSRKRQAELVHQKNQSQLSELEYQAARDRRVTGGYNVIDSMNTSDDEKNRAEASKARRRYSSN
jgi:hypothetical protein